MSSSVTRLKVDDEEFLVASLIDRCPKMMMLRELLQNAIEAASLAPPGRQRIVINAVEINGVRKLRIWNSGPGMDEPQLYRMCDLAASIGKLKGLDQNFGMGAKVASLPSNHLGVRYRSCRFGMVHEVTIGKRNGIYGRVQRPASRQAALPGTQQLVDIGEVTDEAREEGRDLSEDWTEVVLLGMRADQQTATDPYDGDPPMGRYWLPMALYQRFFRIPDGIDIEISPEFHWHAETRRFETLSQRALSAFAGYEAVRRPDGLTIHYFYDPVCPERPWENASSEGALQSTLAQVGLIYRNEIYDLQGGSPWAYEAPNYGITFGARNISVYIELTDNHDVLPDSYRQFVRYRHGSQQPVATREFAALVRTSRPGWLIDVIQSIGGQSQARKAVIDRLGALCRQLNLDALADADTDVAASDAAESPPTAVRIGQTRQTCGFDIVLLHDEQDINDRWLLGRAACFYPATKQLFVNTHYKSVGIIRDMLQEALAGIAVPRLLEACITEVAVECVVTRVGRALLFGISKHLEPENWQSGHIEKAMSPESLSIAADDFYELLPWAQQEVRDRIERARDPADIA